MINLLDDVAYDYKLGPTDCRLLRHIMDVPGLVSTRELADAIWGHREDGGCEHRQIHVWICRLRTKLRPGFSIENESKRGYRLVVEDWALERALISRVIKVLVVDPGARAA